MVPLPWALAAPLLLSAFVPAEGRQDPMRAIPLPAPRRQGALSLEAALAARRSVRDFATGPIALADAAQLLWAAQGTNRSTGGRTAPSAGATYPLELYLVASRVTGLDPGVYRYQPRSHDLVPVTTGERLRDLAAAGLRQEWIQNASAVFAFAAVFERTAQRYGSRAERYVPMEVGHAAQNLYLQAAALQLGTTFVGAFNDSAIASVLGLPGGERPLGLMPVGRPR